MLINLRGVSITSNVGLIKTFITFLGNMFPARMTKTFVVNSPASVHLFWGALKNLLGARTIAKISLVDGPQNPALF